MVMFRFLGTESATMVALATPVPVSILGSFITMRLLGYSVDMFSSGHHSLVPHGRRCHRQE